ncbi:hypothetical protein [Gluconobacter sp.]|uniref:hypothetical protein n=1 Tax=Gluconobacter sp. TaxID=1876758 RepID=UPI0039ECBFE0
MNTRYDRALRFAVAIPVGYVLSALAGICLAFWLPLPRAENAMAGILLGLILWPIIFIASFGFTHIRRLAVGLMGLALLMTALAIGGGWRP